MSATIKICPKPLLSKASSGLAYYRGKCSYRSGKCLNERTFRIDGKTSGAHSLCEDHRTLHNQQQRQSDKMRRALKRKIGPYYVSQQKPHVTRPPITLSSSMPPSSENIMPTPFAEMKWNPTSSLDGDVFELDDHWQWSVEEIFFLQTILMEEPLFELSRR